MSVKDAQRDADATSQGEEGYPLRVATRVTGLKAELLRAWETRHRAIHPRRTPGGTRRYSARDLDRLRLLRDVVASGHRIGRIARLDDDELAALLLASEEADGGPIDRAIGAADRLDAGGVRRILLTELAERGPVGFATELAIPLLVEVGRRWETGRTSVSAEHLVSSLVRSTLTDLVAENDAVVAGRPELVFATLPGESHDLGTLVAAIVAGRAGARGSFLGADIPVTDLATRVAASGASVLVLGIVTLDAHEAESSLVDLRGRLPESVRIWVGGAGIRGVGPIAGVERIENLGQLEAHVFAMGLGQARPGLDAGPPAPASRREPGR